ncbi:MAG: glycosyltransferase family 2 protein [Alistipes sp.]|nr:glycosyltransferase family 2 protein [Alistipes senegalensis]MCM1249637.1 glycosyltransferase family 2 protein [Alistipes sp.]
MPLVKIVILNWNGVAHLRRYLPGVVAAAPEGVGVVVADNGSSDDSVGVLQREFPSVEVLRLDRNYGFAGGYNRALRRIEADYYVLLNSDVDTPAGWLEPLIGCLDRHPDVAAVAPKLRADAERSKFEYAGAAGGYIDFLGYPFCRGRMLRTVEFDRGQYDDERDVFWVSGAAFCCRAEAFHALGGFDDDFFAHMEEIDLCWRMQLAGWRVRIVPQSVVYHLGGGTLSTDSPTKVFFNHRNNLAMLYKCASPGQRAVAAVVRPMLDLLAAASYLLQGRCGAFCAVFRAWRDFLKWHPALRSKRQAIRRSQVGSARTQIYRGSLLLRYLLGRRTFGRMM